MVKLGLVNHGKEGYGFWDEGATHMIDTPFLGTGMANRGNYDFLNTLE